jgi:hypothetical protein
MFLFYNDSSEFEARAAYAAALGHHNGTELPRRLVEVFHSRALLWIVQFAFACTFALFVCFMAYRQQGPANLDAGALGNTKTPPSWSPECERSYSFRHWQRDIMLWALATDLQPHQLAAAVVLRLGGVARDIARDLTPQQLAAGGQVNMPGQGMVNLDGLGFLMHGLETRFGPLAEETNLISMTERMTFRRIPSEPTDSLLARFDTLRGRAAAANLVMSIPGLCFILLNAVGLTTEQRLQLLTPLQGRMPANDAEFGVVVAYLRRMASHCRAR